jgi:WYL domain
MLAAVGRKSAVKTVSAILSAIERQHTWRQPDLAREVGVTVPSLRKHLLELAEILPLDDRKIGQEVEWSLPHGWEANGLRIQLDTVWKIVRVAAHAPKSRARDELLSWLLRKNPKFPSLRRIEADIYSEREEKRLPLVEEAAMKRTVLGMQYFSEAMRQRNVSVQRVLTQRPARFVAYCHLRKGLRMFRVDRIQSAWLEREAAFVDVAEVDVSALVKRAVDGFAGGADHAESECAFTVRDPEARWVRDNLPTGMRVEEARDGGIRVSAHGGALLVVARFVVGLGEAACAETEALAIAVRNIAEGALEANAAGKVAVRT